MKSSRFLLCALLILFGLFWQMTPVVAQVPRSDPAQIKSELNTIFERPEFRIESAQSDNPFTRAWKWLRDQWNGFWKRIEDALNVGGSLLGSLGLQWLFIALFLVGMAWLLARILRGATLSQQKREAGKRTAFDFDEADAETITEPEVWMQQAERFAQEGDFRRAFRAVFIAVLLQLDRAGAVQFDRARTNGDYLRQLRSARLPEALRLFGAFVVEFDQRWYGDQPTAEADYRRSREMQTAILKTLSPVRTDLGTLLSEKA